MTLAGAFGAHIDGGGALVLGLAPDRRLPAVTSVGDAAGHGARIALVTAAARGWRGWWGAVVEAWSHLGLLCAQR